MERRVRVLRDRQSIQAGPSTLERLAQGSAARAKLIEAAREAELARKVTPIADLTSGQITRKRLGIKAVGTAGLVTLVAAIACKGGNGKGVETTPTQPANSPVATETIELTPTPSPEPTPTPQEKLYGPAPGHEELRATIDSTYAQILANGANDQLGKDYLDDQVTICLGENPSFPPNTQDQNLAAQVLGGCVETAFVLKNLKQQVVVGEVDLSPVLEMLKNTYFGISETFIQNKVLPASNLSEDSIRQVIANNFTPNTSTKQ